MIRRDTNIGGFRLSDDPTLRAAIDAYGSPTSRVPYEGQACIVVWSEFGIRITFSHVVSTTPCDGRGCHSETILTNTRWKTDKGLHVGDSLRRLRQVYRRAKLFISQRWTLGLSAVRRDSLTHPARHRQQRPDRRVRRPKSLARVLLERRGRERSGGAGVVLTVAALAAFASLRGSRRSGRARLAAEALGTRRGIAPAPCSYP